MKRFSFFVLGALALCVNACEKHPASQLPPEHSTAFGEHAWPHKGEAKAGGEEHKPAAAAAPAAEHKPAAEAAAAAPATANTESKPAGEAAGFFPKEK